MANEDAQMRSQLYRYDVRQRLVMKCHVQLDRQLSVNDFSKHVRSLHSETVEIAMIVRKWDRIKTIYQLCLTPGVVDRCTSIHPMSLTYRSRWLWPGAPGSDSTAATFLQSMSYEQFYLAFTRFEYVVQLKRVSGGVYSNKELFHELWADYSSVSGPLEMLSVYDILGCAILPSTMLPSQALLMMDLNPNSTYIPNFSVDLTSSITVDALSFSSLITDTSRVELEYYLGWKGSGSVSIPLSYGIDLIVCPHTLRRSLRNDVNRQVLKQ